MAETSFVDKAITLLTGIAALACIAAVGSHYMNGSPSGRPQPVVGEQVRLPGVDWSTNAHTLVFALQPGCPYCKASVPFYRDLLTYRPSTVGFLVAAQVPNAVSTQMLIDYGLQAVPVVQVEFATLKITGTPTLLLVDRQGRLEKEWIGQLSSSYEMAVRKSLGISTHAESVAGPKPEPESRAARSAVLLDTREREVYMQSHLPEAINIPLDELEVRGPHELPRDVRIDVICDDPGSCPISQEHGEFVATRCDHVLEALRLHGITDAVALDSDQNRVDAGAVTPVSAGVATGHEKH